MNTLELVRQVLLLRERGTAIHTWTATVLRKLSMHASEQAGFGLSADPEVTVQDLRRLRKQLWDSVCALDELEREFDASGR